MSKLHIDTLTEDLQLEKKAEEAEMEKVASIVQIVDQASVLTSAGQELYKVAEELENDNLAALAVDIYQTGERMGAALTKMASEDNTGLLESLEIAEDLNKIASVVAEIADEVEDEGFSKMANDITEISNQLTDEANEYAEGFDLGEDSEEVIKEAGSKWEAIKAALRGAASKGKAAGTKAVDAGKAAADKAGIHASKVKAWAKENPKKAIAAGVGTAGALGLAGYGIGKKKD